MQNSVNHAPGLKCKVCPRLLKEVIKWLVHLGTRALSKSTPSVQGVNSDDRKGSMRSGSSMD